MCIRDRGTAAAAAADFRKRYRCPGSQGARACPQRSYPRARFRRLLGGRSSSASAAAAKVGRCQ
eukprot:5002658-Alexandrium_andersonii.AAC.1